MVCTDDGDCAGIGDTLCIPRSGDGCSADCSATEICGDGQPDFGEACDNGSHCDDVPVGAPPGTAGTPCVQGAGSCIGIGDDLCIPRSDDGCSADCSSSEGCGNALRDVDEQCDDGFDGGEDGAIPQGDSCTNLCLFNICGDGIANFAVEDCDSGIGSVVSCDADCTAVECGDGFVNPAAGEQCDNGKTCSDAAPCNTDAECVGIGDEVCVHRDSATCDADCTVAFCGDGFANSQTVPPEACDDAGSSATCNSNCTASACGDGVANPAATTPVEQCDGGGETATCDTDCTIAFCGDSTTNGTASEDCDTGGNSSTCDSDCTTPSCGDGLVNPLASNEACDDGNADNNDDCTNACAFAVCGDSVVHSGGTGSEACDEGGGNTSSCDSDCTVPTCGDGFLNSTTTPIAEQCDDGNTSNLDNCLATCIVASCGDGFLDSAAPGIEECDDGNTNNNDACKNDCTLPNCGDGIRTGAEECDDGNTNNADNCTNACLFNVCGDTFVDAQNPSREDCDDGNASDGDDCLNDCSLNVCGDGFVDSEGPVTEACDDSNSLACGTCSDTCGVSQPPAPATGSIVAVAVADIVDTETFTLDDGTNPATVFEFDTDGTSTGVAIDISGDTSAEDVRDRIRIAINGVGATLQIDATDAALGSTLILTNSANGTSGNSTSSDTVAEAGFVITDMTGGVANDCLAGVGCSVNGDCASNDCSGNICQ
jgi:cysteine-rich repeat protein